MIANFGPANYNFDETISTLRYANRAKNIKNKATVNEDPKDALLRQMQEELDALKKQLSQENENGNHVPTSQLAEMSQDILQQRDALEKDREMVEKDKLKGNLDCDLNLEFIFVFSLESFEKERVGNCKNKGAAGRA